MPILVKDYREYSHTELAGTYRSDAGSQPPVPTAQLEPLLQDLDRQGYLIIPGLLDDAQLREIRDDILPRLQQPGRNNFEGLATQRLYGVIEKTQVCNPLVEHPLVLALLDRLLQPNYLLSQLQAINILPGEAAQPLHHDDAFYPVPRPRVPLGAATVWALDDFTAENGATQLIPGSHRWGERTPRAEELGQLTPALMPAGSLLFFIGTLWHGGGANRSQAARLGITAQYCAPWCRQQENFSLSVSRARAKGCSPHLQRMLGYSIHAPFMGFVDGMHPKRLLED
ncbi:MAG: phytanoyl-CoA dioxygenase family protein [Pseudomonas sp.]|uniref:phytanoyl-CoA dioxygenase family protein n=1 Tax=Pseudomonas sp. TaxID=306 RepID=UPI0033943B6A